MIIQVILISFSTLLLLYMLSSNSTAKISAYKKLALLVLVLAMIIFILYPDSLNFVANKVGIGRGADLLLYIMFCAFLLFVINVYVKFKQQQDTIYRLARKLSIIEASENEHNKKTR